MTTQTNRTTRAEARGIAILSAAIILAVAIPPQIRQIIKKPEPIIIESESKYLKVDTPPVQVKTQYWQPIKTKPAKTELNKEKKQPAKELVDINSTSAERLEEMKGIGPVLSKRIIKFRDKLGGFYALEQVGETYGLDSLVLNEVIDQLHIVVRHSALGLDTSSFKTLLRHPYLEFDHVKILKSHDFEDDKPLMDQLIQSGIPPAVSQKVHPYLRVTSVIDG